MIIGIPKGLLYYRYEALWRSFFHTLKIETLVSQNTDYGLMAEGIRNTADESCLPAKIYLGHVRSLAGKCDYILVPRFDGTGKNEKLCERFFGMYDTVKNTFPGVRLLDYNLSSKGLHSEARGFVEMGARLGKHPFVSLFAYNQAKKTQKEQQAAQVRRQKKRLAAEGAKILLVSQPYVIHDTQLGKPLLQILKDLNITPVFSDDCDAAECVKASRKISKQLYWSMNKESIGSIPLLQNQVDGVILLTAYPCGTDSLVNEMVMRKVRDIPVIQILLDEQQGEAGLQTRLESFADIIAKR
ncbi:MAG: acyl-CoA dehydratase activase-related protein [Oscillospiraceae bacterium]|nr:acyl-CoA dehydratase activase-related protein [Oscillospiraceae bacterium]